MFTNSPLCIKSARDRKQRVGEGELDVRLTALEPPGGPSAAVGDGGERVGVEILLVLRVHGEKRGGRRGEGEEHHVRDERVGGVVVDGVLGGELDGDGELRGGDEGIETLSLVGLHDLRVVAHTTDEARNEARRLLQEGEAVDEHADAVVVLHVQLEGREAVERLLRQGGREAVVPAIPQGEEGIRTSYCPRGVVEGRGFPEVVMEVAPTPFTLRLDGIERYTSRTAIQHLRWM